MDLPTTSAARRPSGRSLEGQTSAANRMRPADGDLPAPSERLQTLCTDDTSDPKRRRTIEFVEESSLELLGLDDLIDAVDRPFCSSDAGVV